MTIDEISKGHTYNTIANTIKKREREKAKQWEIRTHGQFLRTGIKRKPLKLPLILLNTAK